MGKVNMKSRDRAVYAVYRDFGETLVDTGTRWELYGRNGWPSSRIRWMIKRGKAGELGRKPDTLVAFRVGEA